MAHDLAGCLRVLLESILEGDELEFEGRRWTAKTLHEDRTVSLTSIDGQQGTTRRVLLKDCSLKRPEGAFRQKKIRDRKNLQLLSSDDDCRLNASGQGSRNRSRVGQIDREGCHFLLPVALSAPVPPNLAVTRLRLEAKGMDQGWGNSGDSGLLVYLRRVEGDQLDEPLMGITYDRQRSSSHQHQAVSEHFQGSSGPQGGDRFLVLLRCPNYPCWSAYCNRVNLTVDCQEEVEETLPWSLSPTWQDEQEKAFFRLWAALAEDDYLSLDMSHLSLTGQQLQHVWTPVASLTPSTSSGATGAIGKMDLVTRFDALLTTHSASASLKPKVRENARRLLEKLQRNENAVGAPAQAQERTARYSELSTLVHRTFETLEKGFASGSGELLAAVLQQYADCVDDCIYRWEREIHNMHDLVTGDVTGEGALDAEDEVLRVLYRKRRQMAESVLHHTKGANETADMHFESHFYASLHFGLAEQLTARRDPHRLTYLALESRVRPEDLQRQLFQDYVPARLRQCLREEIFESTATGSQALREKITNWFSAHIPGGFRASEAAERRREAWLYQFCYDESFRITDEALNYMMCCMHILSARSLILQGWSSMAAGSPQPDLVGDPSESERSERSVPVRPRSGCTVT